MKCVVVDDELPALELMVRELQKCGDIQVIEQFTDSEQLLRVLPHLQADVIFLDIHMPAINGLQLLPAIRAANPDIKIVFVTAHSQYAVDAFEEAVFDYVVKPIYRERLQKTIDRMRKTVPPVVPTVTCFGKLQVQYGDTFVRWQTAKAEEMFAYVMFHKTVRADKLQEDLFAHFSPDKGKSYIYTCTYMIRKSLEKAGLDEHIRIESGSGAYRMYMSGVMCEWERWRTLIEKSDEEVWSVNHLMWAFERLQHPLFQGVDSEWLNLARYKVEQQLIQVCCRCLLAMPFRKVPGGRDMLFRLLDYIDVDESFWVELLQKLKTEQSLILAKELQEKMYRLMSEQLGEATADRWRALYC